MAIISRSHALRLVRQGKAVIDGYTVPDKTTGQTRIEYIILNRFDMQRIDHFLGFESDTKGCNAGRSLKTGDRVEGGQGEDHDTGRIESIDGDTALVAWDSGVKTPAPLSILRAI